MNSTSYFTLADWERHYFKEISFEIRDFKEKSFDSITLDVKVSDPLGFPITFKVGFKRWASSAKTRIELMGCYKVSFIIAEEPCIPYRDCRVGGIIH